MSRLIVTQGRNSWTARTGYQDRLRVPGPIHPMEYPRPSLWQRITRAADGRTWAEKKDERK